MSKPELTFQSNTKILYGYDPQTSLEKIISVTMWNWYGSQNDILCNLPGVSDVKLK